MNTNPNTPYTVAQVEQHQQDHQHHQDQQDALTRYAEWLLEPHPEFSEPGRYVERSDTTFWQKAAVVLFCVLGVIIANA